MGAFIPGANPSRGGGKAFHRHRMPFARRSKGLSLPGSIAAAPAGSAGRFSAARAAPRTRRPGTGRPRLRREESRRERDPGRGRGEAGKEGLGGGRGGQRALLENQMPGWEEAMLIQGAHCRSWGFWGALVSNPIRFAEEKDPRGPGRFGGCPRLHTSFGVPQSVTGATCTGTGRRSGARSAAGTLAGGFQPGSLRHRPSGRRGWGGGAVPSAASCRDPRCAPGHQLRREGRQLYPLTSS